MNLASLIETAHAAGVDADNGVGMSRYLFAAGDVLEAHGVRNAHKWASAMVGEPSDDWYARRLLAMCKPPADSGFNPWIHPA